MGEITALLVGNQNCGKSALFNRLTGGHAQVGNWPGVTVAQRAGRAGEITLVDLPGLYALDAASPEEQLTAVCLRESADRVIVAAADATCLARSLYLPLQLTMLGRPMVLTLTMMDEVRRRGGQIDTDLLSRMLGIPVIPVSARTGEGLASLLHAIRTEAVTPPGLPVTDDPVARYRFIDERLLRCIVRPCRPNTASDRLDQWALRPVTAAIFLLTIVAGLMSMICGAPARLMTGWVEVMLSRCGESVAAWMAAHAVSPWLQGLVLEGLLPGMTSVLSFAPMILLLFLGLTLLEDSGCMARASFLLDMPMRRLGLSGRSLFPLLMGCGCTVTSAMAARSISEAQERRHTIRLACFVPCGAKLPVCIMIAGSAFPRHAPWIVAGLLMLVLLLGILTSRTRVTAAQSPLLLEMPSWRIPTVRGVLRTALHHVAGFLRRVTTVILLSSIAVWLARTYRWDLMPAASFTDSILGGLSAAASILLTPLGFPAPEAAASLLTGLLAKENVVSTMHILTGGDLTRLLPTPLSAVSFLTFFMLYPPCIAALSAIRHESPGKSDACRSVVFQTLLAWVSAFAVQTIGRICMSVL